MLPLYLTDDSEAAYPPVLSLLSMQMTWRGKAYSFHESASNGGSQRRNA